MRVYAVEVSEKRKAKAEVMREPSYKFQAGFCALEGPTGFHYQVESQCDSLFP
jgi:hypothetical protein